ncbi:MAG: LON peptidase substrate-binding domain-containing protein, partial [Bacteriovoracaceae bacterium]
MSSKNDTTIKLNPQVEQLSEMPKEVVVIPIVNSPIFPGMIAPIILSEEKFTPELDQQVAKSGYVALNLVKFKEMQEVMESLEDDEEDFEEDEASVEEYEMEAYEPDLKDLTSKDIYKVGVLCKVVKKLKLPDGSVNLLVHGLKRYRITSFIQESPLLIVKTEV